MSNFFLLNHAIDFPDYDYSVSGLLKLASIRLEKDDTFFKHGSVYYINLYSSLCQNYGPDEQTLLLFIEQLSNSTADVSNAEELNAIFQHETNAFLGINFAETAIEVDIQVKDEASYKNFNEVNLWKVSYKNFWGKRKKLFPSLIFCPQIEDHVYSVGNSGHFNQIVERLREFNKAVSEWKAGAFSYKEVNKNYALRISPESELTMSKFGNERIFPLPKGGTAYFELHIKTGGLRFHFFPQNETKIVFIGYIGSHLSTVSN